MVQRTSGDDIVNFQDLATILATTGLVVPMRISCKVEADCKKSKTMRIKLMNRPCVLPVVVAEHVTDNMTETNSMKHYFPQILKVGNEVYHMISRICATEYSGVHFQTLLSMDNTLYKYDANANKNYTWPHKGDFVGVNPLSSIVFYSLVYEDDAIMKSRDSTITDSDISISESDDEDFGPIIQYNKDGDEIGITWPEYNSNCFCGQLLEKSKLIQCVGGCEKYFHSGCIAEEKDSDGAYLCDRC